MLPFIFQFRPVFSGSSFVVWKWATAEDGFIAIGIDKIMLHVWSADGLNLTSLTCRNNVYSPIAWALSGAVQCAMNSGEGTIMTIMSCLMLFLVNVKSLA